MSQLEEHPGSAGALRALGAWGPFRGPHVLSHSPGLRAGALALAGMAVVVVGAALAVAHEERLVIGRLERVDRAQNVLVVQDAERDRTVRILVDADTEVRRCRGGRPLADVKPGARVRLTYLDRGGGGLETLSILVLAGEK